MGSDYEDDQRESSRFLPSRWLEFPGRCWRGGGKRSLPVLDNRPSKWHILQSDPDDASDTESEFEADPEELVSEQSSEDVSDYDASDASDDDGSASDFGGDESDEGNI